MYELVEKNGYHETLIATGTKEHCAEILQEAKQFTDMYQGRLIIRKAA